MAATSTADRSTRFLFSRADIRGEVVHLNDAYQELLGAHDYSATTATLLGQFAAAAVLISNNLKYHGRIILQARSERALSLIMVECSSELEIRGIARGDISNHADNPLDLIAGGQLALTIERDGGQRYQGIVALDADSLADALSDYFEQSEQLQTRFMLAASAGEAAGFMLQQLPAQVAQDAADRQEQWQTVTVLADTLTQNELLTLDAEVLLHRLYHEYDLQLFEPKALTYRCRCTRQRSLDALSLLPADELEAALEDEGVITMTCEMCNATYEFAREELPTLAEDRILH
ncbi:MAG: Hsp33 family molecular chaperone HslO [Halieaceae bacterium]|jgi:molecular chaperone Hsp33|nr:Hsp33 family molecular chaperone HslO [Halieaceae bacterium]